MKTNRQTDKQGEEKHEISSSSSNNNNKNNESNKYEERGKVISDEDNEK